jgi:UrcA family protein
MTSNVWCLPATCLALVGGLTIESGAAQAQQNGTLEEITVVAPRLVTRPAGRTAAGSKVELISLTRHVVYSDLNLTLHNDVVQLEKRVSDVAKEACDTLAKMYPLSDPNTPNCVEQAGKDAKAQIDRLAAAAMKDQRR